MKLPIRFLSTALSAILLTSCSGGGSSSSQESFVPGNGSVILIKAADRMSAPNLSGMTLSGKEYSLKFGQVIVVNVWASWCAPCRAEIPTLIALSKQYNDVNFVGILTRDNPPTAEAFQRHFAIPYPTLIDDSILLGFKGSLAANAIPTTVVIDRNGKVAGRISGEVTIASLSKLIDAVSTS